MDEYRNEAEDFDVDEFDGEEEFELPEIAEEDTTDSDAIAAAAAAATKASELADLQKMYRQHPNIWIPYEEQVFQKLNTTGPNDANHKTYPYMTQYEKTKAISFRASMLCNGAKPYIVVPEGVTDSYQIAKMELLAKRLPFIFKRPLPNGNYEYWKLSDLLLPEESNI